MISGSNITVILILFLSFLLLVVVWKRRKLYYASSKLDGPFALPFVGSIQIFSGGHKMLYIKLKKVFACYPPLAKIWLGPELFFIDSRPEDMDILLNNSNCLGKGFFYIFGKELLGDSLPLAPLDIWKRHRRFINPSFNLKLLNSYHKVFVKHANIFNNVLGEHCGKGKFDLIPKLFVNQLNIVFETMADVEPSKIKGQEDYIKQIFKCEELIISRMFNPLLHVSFVWSCSSLYKEMMLTNKKIFAFVQQVVDLRRYTFNKHSHRNKNFLNNILQLNDTNQFTEKEVLDETNFMLLSGSETTTITLSFVMLVLGMLPHIQEKMVEELEAIFGESDRDPTEDDMNKMQYLEQVIKETLRLMPPVPVIARNIANDVTLSDGFVFPSGSNVFIPIVQMHRDPVVWPDPLKFDPDRFLPEEIEKRHKLSFIPFSYGVRNCIGFKYAMLSMKVVLSTIIRKYKVVSVDYKSIEDIEVEFLFIVKPIKGCQVVLEKRIK